MAETLGEQARQDAARAYFPLVIWLAKDQWARLPKGVVELDDLIGEASLGLVKCLHRYDLSQNTPLSYWVSKHIRWALLEYLRKLDLVSQATREMKKVLQESEADLEKQLHRKPTRAEIAAFLGCPVEVVERIMQMADITMVSLDAEGAPPLPDRRDPSEQVEQTQRVHSLQECLATLVRQEQVAVRMHLEESRLEDIGVVLRVSTATAGRRVNNGLHKLIQCMKDKGW